MKVLKIIGILVIVLIVGAKILSYYHHKKDEEARKKLQKVFQYEKMIYAAKFKEGLKAANEGNYTKAKNIFEDVCKNLIFSNNPTACYNLGIMYYNGFGVDKNYSMAKQYFEKAAENGFIDSYSQLVIIENKEQNIKKALDYAKKGCNLNSAMSCFYAGAIYYDGDNIEKNLTLAKHFWKKALKLLPTANMPESPEKKEKLKKLVCNTMSSLCDSNSTKGQ